MAISNPGGVKIDTDTLAYNLAGELQIKDGGVTPAKTLKPYNIGNEVLFSNDASASGDDQVIKSFDLSGSGTHTIRVTFEVQGNGTNNRAWELRVDGAIKASGVHYLATWTEISKDIEIDFDTATHLQLYSGTFGSQNTYRNFRIKGVNTQYPIQEVSATADIT